MDKDKILVKYIALNSIILYTKNFSGIVNYNDEILFDKKIFNEELKGNNSWKIISNNKSKDLK